MLTGYVHRWTSRQKIWTGTGWRQPFQLELLGSGQAALPSLPHDIAGGTLLVTGSTHSNLIPYPLLHRGPARLVLELTAGGMLELSGELGALRAIGDARFVENLPSDFAP
jgi:hypothetical protein